MLKEVDKIFLLQKKKNIKIKFVSSQETFTCKYIFFYVKPQDEMITHTLFSRESFWYTHEVKKKTSTIHTYLQT